MKSLFKSVSLLVVLATTVLTMSVTSFGANVTETQNVLESGSKKSIVLADHDDTADYKIKVSEAGTLKISITSLINYLEVYVCDIKGKAIEPSNDKTSTGDSYYSDLFGRETLVWNGAVEKFSGSLFYELEKGTYFIRFKRDGYKGTGKISLTATYPSSDKTEPDVKINYVSVPLKKGETLQLSASLSDKTTETVKWSSSDKSIATVSSKGKVKGVSKGSAVITAKIGNSTYKVYVNITN